MAPKGRVARGSSRQAALDRASFCDSVRTSCSALAGRRSIVSKRAQGRVARGSSRQAVPDRGFVLRTSSTGRSLSGRAVYAGFCGPRLRPCRSSALPVSCTSRGEKKQSFLVYSSKEKAKR